MNTASIVIYTLLGFFVVIFELKRRKELRYDMLSLFHARFVFVFCLAGITFHSTGLLLERFSQIGFVPRITVWGSIAVLVGYLSLITGFYFPGTRRWGTRIRLVEKRRTEGHYFIFLTALLLLGAVSVFVFSIPYGGILNTISFGDEIRAGRELRSPLAFFARFFPFVALVNHFSLFFLLRTEYRVRFRPVWYVLFASSLLVFIPIALIDSSRATVVSLVVINYLIIVSQTQRWQFKYLLPACVVGVIFITFGDAVFKSLIQLKYGLGAFTDMVALQSEIIKNRTQNFNEGFLSFMTNFEPTTFSIHVALENTGPNPARLNLWKDLFQAPLTYIPGGPKFASINNINTWYIFQVPEPPTSISPGWIAASFYQGWWPGLVVNGFALGLIFRVFQNIFLMNWKNYFWVPSVFAFIAFLGSGTFGGFNFIQTAGNYFPYFVFFALLFLLFIRIRRV